MVGAHPATPQHWRGMRVGDVVPRADRPGRRAVILGAGAMAFAAPALGQGQIAAPRETLHGIGATVPHRLYRAWADRFGPDLGLDLTYVPLGSGAGRRAAAERQADFGGSDTPMPPQDLAGADLAQVQTVSAALGFVVNLPGIDTRRLRLGRDDLLAIFTGDIRVWSDPRLRARNRDLDLPHLAITPILRRDASGSTSLAAAWLSGGDAGAAQETGQGPLDRAPGLAAFGAHGVALSLRRLRGSIGYLETSSARQFGLQVIALETAEGRFATLAPTAGGADWPLVIPTNILIPRDAARRHRSAMVAGFFRHCLLQGDEIAASAGYLPLSDDLRAGAVTTLTALCDCA